MKHLLNLSCSCVSTETTIKGKTVNCKNNQYQTFWVSIVTHDKGICYNRNTLMTLDLLYVSIETISSIRVYVTIETLVEPFMCFNWNYRIAICFNWNYNKREKSQPKKHLMPSSAAVVKLLESGLVIRGTGDWFSVVPFFLVSLWGYMLQLKHFNGHDFADKLQTQLQAAN